MHVFIIIKLAHPSYFCAEPSAQRDAFMQNRYRNGCLLGFKRKHTGLDIHGTESQKI